MIGLCFYDFLKFYNMEDKPYDTDLVAVLFVFSLSILIEIHSPSKAYFDRTEKIIGRYMMLSFVRWLCLNLLEKTFYFISVIAFIVHMHLSL